VRPPSSGLVRDDRLAPVELLGKAWSRLRARGLVDGVSQLGKRIAAEVLSSDRLIFFVRDATGPWVHAHRLELRFATEADAKRYAHDIGTESPRTFARRLSQGTECFLVVSEGRALHATWITQSAAWTTELRRYVCPPEGDAYVYESFTRADARGRGLYPQALRAICAALEKRSVQRVWVGVENRNVPSLRAVTKAGFEEAVTIDHRRVLGRLLLGRAQPRPGWSGPWIELRREATPSTADQASGEEKESKP
jgi:ribosomal protein S18 acetylase RimI-like enzyme